MNHTEPPRTISYTIRSLSNQIKRLLDSSADGALQPLTGMQFAVISYVENRSRYSDVFQRDLEAAFNIRRSTATLILQRMKRGNLLRREAVSHDARLKKIVLTEHAIQIHKQQIAHVAALERRIRQGLSQEEQETFYRLVDKISQNIQN